MSRLVDTGTYLEVPEDQRINLDDNPVEEVNEDEFVDLSDIDPGKVIELSTAYMDEEGS